MGENLKRKRLESGETFVTSEKGNSMTPLIKSGQEHELSPCELKDVSIGDIVYAKVGNRYYTHLVKNISKEGLVLIGNNHGGTNGWTDNVYGKVTEVFGNKHG